METGIATFETVVPDWDGWNAKFLKQCRFVAEGNAGVIGWCGLTAFSSRAVYRGVAEVTIYVAAAAQGQGVGQQLLSQLVEASEAAGFWTLLAKIFEANTSSIHLHKKQGFRQVGVLEKLGMRDGIWHNNVLLERRSEKMNLMKNVLVLCTGNSCRSQMAHGYLNQMAQDTAIIYSAGIETHGINPGAAATMAKAGIDITGHTSNNVTEYDGISWDFIITVCDHAYENCPFIAAPNAKRLHHNFYDPSKFAGGEEETEAAFAKARNEIKAYCQDFVAEYL
ncbi:MAG: arsenate reductase [Gammaproteobacteria bacterium]|jgi:arsenate reductase